MIFFYNFFYNFFYIYLFCFFYIYIYFVFFFLKMVKLIRIRAIAVLTVTVPSTTISILGQTHLMFIVLVLKSTTRSVAPLILEFFLFPRHITLVRGAAGLLQLNRNSTGVHSADRRAKFEVVHFSQRALDKVFLDLSAVGSSVAESALEAAVIAHNLLCLSGEKKGNIAVHKLLPLQQGVNRYRYNGNELDTMYHMHSHRFGDVVLNIRVGICYDKIVEPSLFIAPLNSTEFFDVACVLVNLGHNCGKIHSCEKVDVSGTQVFEDQMVYTIVLRAS
jgi:hypothetical protein